MDNIVTNKDLYEGERNSEGEPHGKGKITYTNEATYEGEFENGKPHGFGKKSFKSGITYEGEFKNGKYDGNGKLTDNGKVVLEGIWDADTPVGHYAGKKIYENGSIYVGEFNDEGVPCGKGAIVYKGGSKYEGDVVSGLPHGKGVWTQSGGSTETCEWREGNRYGDYTLAWSDGCRISKREYLEDGTSTNGKMFCFVPAFLDGSHRKEFDDGGYFDGEWKDGWFVNGKVKVMYNARPRTVEFDSDGFSIKSDGKVYAQRFCEGYFADGQFNGLATEVSGSGTRYEGEMRDGERHGQGIMLFAKEGELTGRKYDGQWQNGQIHGRGVYINAKGSCYEGEVANGNYHGQGVMLYATDGKLNGNKYDGQWKNDVWHGSGVHTTSRGIRYEGEVANGNYHGKGVMLYATDGKLDGRKYDGQWQNGKWHGHGIYITSKGNRYEGEFLNSNYNGQGTYTFKDGRYYIGSFKDDKFHGKGVTYSADDVVVKEGEWKEGEFTG